MLKKTIVCNLSVFWKFCDFLIVDDFWLTGWPELLIKMRIYNVHENKPILKLLWNVACACGNQLPPSNIGETSIASTCVVPPTLLLFRPDLWPRGASTYCLARYVTFSLYVTLQYQPTSHRILEVNHCWFIWPALIGSLAGLRPIYCPHIRVK